MADSYERGGDTFLGSVTDRVVPRILALEGCCPDLLPVFPDTVPTLMAEAEVELSQAQLADMSSRALDSTANLRSGIHVGFFEPNSGGFHVI